MTRRLRTVAYVVQPQFMVDDGETLTPLAVQPLTVAAADWPNVVEMVTGAAEQLRQQVEGPAESPPPPPPSVEERFCPGCQKYKVVDSDDRCVECGAAT